MTLPPDQLALVQLLEGARDALTAHAELIGAAAERLRQREEDDPTEGQPPVMTVAQVAEFLGVSVRHIERHVERGRIPAIDLGLGGKATVRITRTDLRKAMRKLGLKRNALQKGGAA